MIWLAFWILLARALDDLYTVFSTTDTLGARVLYLILAGVTLLGAYAVFMAGRYGIT